MDRFQVKKHTKEVHHWGTRSEAGYQPGTGAGHQVVGFGRPAEREEPNVKVDPYE